MKKTVLNYLVIAVFAVSAAFASNNGNNIAKLPETITKSDGSYRKFEYDSQNRITKILVYNDGKLYRTLAFTYSGNNLVKLALNYPEYGIAETEEYAKHENQITITHVSDMGGGDGILDLSDDGYPTNYYGSDGHNLGFAYNYTTQNGNITKVTTEQHRHGGGYHILKFSAHYTYDDKKSPFTHCTTPKWWMIIDMWEGMNSIGAEYGCKNNVIEENWSGILNDVEENRSEDYTGKREYTYEYDNEGYPTKCTVKHLDGKVDVYTFKYVG